MTAPQHIRTHVYHARRGEVRNVFSYGADFVLLDPERPAGLRLLSRDRFNLWSVHDRHHGGARGAGRGAAWAREALAARGYGAARTCRMLLLTQPSFLGFHFNPVSFWLAFDGEALRAVIAEVNNTFGDRHSYLCALPGFAPIGPKDEICAQKAFHVSPFQAISGVYHFNFNITAERLTIRITLRDGAQGVITSMAGARAPATDAGLMGAALRRPFGALRVLALIHWQAAKLAIKGARYRRRPSPPTEEIS